MFLVAWTHVLRYFISQQDQSSGFNCGFTQIILLSFCTSPSFVYTWIAFSKVVATFNHVCGSFDLFMATTGHVWIVPSFRISGYVLYVEHISCVITNCGQHQWVIPALFSIAFEALLEENITRKLLSLSLDLIFKNLIFQVTFLIFFTVAVFSAYFLLFGLLLQQQYVALFQFRELVKV